MALTECRECGHRVSDQAQQCPSCGISSPAPEIDTQTNQVGGLPPSPPVVEPTVAHVVASASQTEKSNKWKWVGGGALAMFGLFVVLGSSPTGGCNVEIANGSSNSYMVNGQLDYGISVYTTVKNEGRPRLVTIESMVSSSEGAWTRKKQVHLDRGEAQRMEIFFEQPSIFATNIKYTSKCI